MGQGHMGQGHTGEDHTDRQPDTALIVLAGGSGRRMAATMNPADPMNPDDNGPSNDQSANRNQPNKVYLPLGGRDILEYSLTTADQCPMVSEIVLVIRAGDEQHMAQMMDRLTIRHPIRVTVGGSTRQGSESAGLSVLRDRIENGTVTVVAIHDGARPFMTVELLEATIKAARQSGGAVPGLEPAENLYRVTSGVLEPLPTNQLRRVQTPQTFQARPLLTAYDRAAETGFQGVDTAETVERFSDLEVRIVPGDHRNIKVTFADDMLVAERQAETWPGPAETNGR